MSYSRRSSVRDDSRSPSPLLRRARSISRSPLGSRSHSSRYDSDVENPGNNLYVTGLSSRVTKKDLEKHFSSEGKIIDIHLVVDPWTRESRGFGFVTMETVEEANRCIKYLDRSVLEGRVITVERAKRRRGRTPTPGKYLGVKPARGRHRSPSYSPYRLSRSCSSERDRSYSPDYRSRRYRSPSPYYLSPYCRSRSPPRRRSRLSYSPYGDRSPRYRSCSRSVSPRYRRSRRSYSRSISPRYRRSKRSYSRSVSPRYRSSRRSYSRSVSPRYRSSRRCYSRSISPDRGYSRSVSRSPPRKSLKRDLSPSLSAKGRRGYSRESYSHSRSRSRSVSSRSRSLSP
ncbi:hypothetical protein QJS10_CPA03g01829 [Acorus calamus]|uniref:RRM domain-containing protein n=1 Tax=Acorus calamus TaxID=4465 RepID=A0AAV9F8U4_ACOCL|nr:hypothetical protein QJS10_CPA03g01829 [Acorus calamus]